MMLKVDHIVIYSNMYTCLNGELSNQSQLLSLFCIIYVDNGNYEFISSWLFIVVFRHFK